MSSREQCQWTMEVAKAHFVFDTGIGVRNWLLCLTDFVIQKHLELRCSRRVCRSCPTSICPCISCSNASGFVLFSWCGGGCLYASYVDGWQNVHVYSIFKARNSTGSPRLLWNTGKAHASFKVDMWDVPSSKESYDSANPADMLWIMTRYLSSIWNKSYLGLVVWFQF